MGRKNYRIGEKNINKQGIEMEIIGYRNRRNMDVKFSDGYISNSATYNNFLSGSLSSPMTPSNLGVGFIGVGKYKTRENGEKTLAYTHWSSMLTRCYSEKYIKSPNYDGCYVCDEWHNFQNFAKWHEENFYELEDDVLELDKDIIFKGNKVYSPDTCFYIPHKLNTILCNRHNDRGKYLIGVSKRCNSKYISACSINGESKHIGSFDTEYEAFCAYKSFKEKEIARVADTYKGRIPQIIIDLVKRYKVEICD